MQRRVCGRNSGLGCIASIASYHFTVETETSKRENAKSQSIFKVASRLIPCGTNAPLDSVNDRESFPTYFAKGQGARLFDVDGHGYIDYVTARGSLILGHADERVVVAIDKAASKGANFGAPTEAESKLAELIAGRLPMLDRIRFVNSVTDAALAVFELARVVTGRSMFVRFRGCPGPIDSLVPCLNERMDDESGALLNNGLASLILPYDDLSAAWEIFETHGESIAAVVVEPIATRMGLIPPGEGFLAGLRQICDAHKCLLVFDETTTSFRVGPAGAAGLYNICPDLLLFGPSVGGGLPLAAMGGKKEVMEQYANARFCDAATLTGNPLAVVASLASLQALGEEGFYASLDEMGEALEAGLTEAANETDVPLSITRVGSMLSVLPQDESVTSWAEAQRVDHLAYRRLRQGLLNEGVLWPACPLDCLFVSAAHDETIIEETVNAAREVFAQLKQA